MGLFDLFKKKEKAAQATQTKKQEGTIPQTKKGDYQPEEYYTDVVAEGTAFEKRVISFEELHMPPQKCSLTADDGASPPLEWCTHSAEMVHGGRRRGTPDRHAGDYSGIPLRLRMDSPSIWMV